MQRFNEYMDELNSVEPVIGDLGNLFIRITKLRDDEFAKLAKHMVTYAFHHKAHTVEVYFRDVTPINMILGNPDYHGNQDDLWTKTWAVIVWCTLNKFS